MSDNCDLVVVGASGQDGPLVMAAGRAAGLTVAGTSRSGARDCLQLDPADPAAVVQMFDRLRPRRIIVLAGQSSVRVAFEHPAETVTSHVLPLLACLDWIRRGDRDTRLVYAASGECFGSRPVDRPAREDDAFAPGNPYAAAKAMGATLLRSYRETYGLHAANAFLFNHESASRDETFLFGKLLGGLRRLKRDPAAPRIALGDLSVVRDWGWAPDYAAAMLAMTDLAEPRDLILATGRSVVLRDAVAAVVAAAGFSWAEAISGEAAAHSHHRPGDTQYADPARARAIIGWTGSVAFPALADQLVTALA